MNTGKTFETRTAVRVESHLIRPPGRVACVLRPTGQWEARRAKTTMDRSGGTVVGKRVVSESQDVYSAPILNQIEPTHKKY